MIATASSTVAQGSVLIAIPIAFVAGLISSPKGVAVAIDREVVPRSAWSSTLLTDGQVVEIVTAAAGG